jgi:peptide/nickel transport system substrate-binding protein/oligopeptide transport system substrate-binding protein
MSRYLAKGIDLSFGSVHLGPPRSFYVLFFLFFLIIGCEGKSSSTKVLHLALNSDLSTLDPAFCVDVDSGAVLTKIYNNLIRYNEKLEIVPDLAYKWIISADGKTYTFYLSKGIKFHDGKMFSAEDVKKSFDRVLDINTISPRRWIFNKIAQIKVKNPYEISIILKEPFAPFLGLLTMSNAAIVSFNTQNNILGTGPFKFKKWLRGEKIILAKNERYFLTPPFFDEIEYRIINDPLRRVMEFENGTLDIIEVPAVELPRFQKSARWSPYILSGNVMNTYYLGINCQTSPHNNLDLRKAIAHAIDKTKIIQSIRKEAVIEAGMLTPPYLGLEMSEIKYSYNPDLAKKILQENGFANGFKTQIWLSDNKESLEVVEIIQAQLKNVGIEVEIVQREWSSFKKSVSLGEAPMFYLSWWADYVDPENFLVPLFHSKNYGLSGNTTFYNNPDVDRLLNEAEITMNNEKRKGLYSQAQNIILEDCPAVFLWHRRNFLIYQPYLKGVKIYPLYTGDKGIDIQILNSKS